jgi:hypothetical protein
MNDSEQKCRGMATKALATIGEMFPGSHTAKRLDGSDSHTYESLVRMWARGMRDVSEKQLSRGLQVLLDSRNKFEPSLPEFLGMCRQMRQQSHDPYKSLPSPRENHARASISHYPVIIKNELERIGLLPMESESMHEYALRCRAYGKPTVTIKI